jgi:hypothetical protein
MDSVRLPGEPHDEFLIIVARVGDKPLLIIGGELERFPLVAFDVTRAPRRYV